MKLTTKQKLDFYLGGAGILILRPLVMFIGMLMRRDHRLQPQKNLTFIKFLGGGSLIIAMPALLGLRKAYPTLTFTLITTKAVKPFADSLGVFDNIKVIDDTKPLSLLVSGFRALLHCLTHDTIIDLEVYSRLSAIFSLATLARNRIGFYLDSVIWRRSVYTHLLFFNRFSGSYHFYEAVCRLLYAEPAHHLECRMKLKIGEVPQHFQVKTPFIVIGAICSDFAVERMLTSEQWIAAIANNKPTTSNFVFLGGPNDKETIQKLITALQEAYPNYSFFNGSGYSLSESLAILKQASAFWGIDSSLLHYARILGLSCTSYWGPTDPRTRLKPFPKIEEQVHYQKTPCSPCVHVAESPPCGGHNQCIKHLFDKRMPQKDTIIYTFGQKDVS